MPPALELTHRELEIWQLTALGLSLRQTAKRLRLKLHTVVQYRKTLYQAIHVDNVIAATHAAVAHGVVAIEPAPTTLVVSPRRTGNYRHSQTLVQTSL